MMRVSVECFGGQEIEYDPVQMDGPLVPFAAAPGGCMATSIEGRDYA